MQHEEWRPIADFPHYEISSFGRVRSWKGGGTAISDKPRLKKLRLNKGYLYVNLSKNNREKSASISRLVAIAFIPGDHSLEVAHLDNNSMNNCVSNLAWVTRRENEAHKLLFGTIPKGERHVSTKLTDAQVAEIVALGRAGFKKCELAKRFGISVPTVSRYCRSGSRTNPYYRKAGAA